MRLPNYKEATQKIDEVAYINYECFEVFEKPLTYYIKTFGCQMNERDSETVKGILDSLGFVEVFDVDEADIIGINTCSIRENAHNKVFGLLGNIKQKEAFIMIFGCMAQEEGVSEELLKKHKEVDLVFGTHNIHDLPHLLKKAFQKRHFEIPSSSNLIVENAPVKRTSNKKAYINIIYGCNKFCTYCIVPFTRGREKSRKKEDILKEAKDLIEEGYLEICLLGQNVNAYGKDLNDGSSLADLLEDIAKLGVKRLTFMTSHPWDFTDQLIEVIGKYPNIMPFVHLPVQSGSNEILKRMNRRYTKEEYLTIVQKLRKKVDNLRLTTDIIVGFPGETVKDFKETLDLVKKAQFDGAFTFIYSPRENTRASGFEDQIDLEISKGRLYQLNNLINDLSKKSNEKLVGEEISVLIDKPGKEGFYLGTSYDGRLITVKSAIDITDKLVLAKVKCAKSWSINADYLEEL